ncbi:MAG: hypothetical protein ACREOF_10385 [Gemmatimonadales bacterium]
MSSESDLAQDEPRMPTVEWDIRRAGRACVGADAAVRLGDPEVWRAAIRELG